MANLNVTCPECGKKFHACYSCGLPHDYLYNYCSEECYRKSLTYDEKKRTVIRLILEAKKDIYKLDDLSDYLQDEALDEIFLILEEPEVQKVWYGDKNE